MLVFEANGNWSTLSDAGLYYNNKTKKQKKQNKNAVSLITTQDLTANIGVFES